MSSNAVKCRYCPYQSMRFKGRGNLVGHKRLFHHVINNHEREFLDSIGFAGTMMEYLDMLAEEEDVIQNIES